MLAGRHVVLAVSGGVAAFKAAFLARRLLEAGADVRAVMTRSSQQFLGAQSMAAITGIEPVLDLFSQTDVSPHTSLARWADVIVVAPATAATMARLASGLSEDVVSATVLASTCPVVVAPAMHTEMWEHPATQRNVATLKSDGYLIVGPTSGALAGGDVGAGRMVEPEEIVAATGDALGDRSMEGWRVVVSAGGTREAIDPVRYIGNRSSGKMGNAIAVAAANAGAAVTLVTTVPAPHHKAIEVIDVESADEMAEAVWKTSSGADVAVLAAAVADFRPADPANDKLRRAEGPPQVHLEPTPDILAGVAAMDNRPYLVGFAAEVGSVDAAVAKAARKQVDLLVANDVARPGSGFGTETNEVTIVTPDGDTVAWELLTKTEVARRLIAEISQRRNDAGQT
ncbi:MAG: bifunctional phosphopantothenoylcysteine decarboxylase/phosphopantothenate--cysteine ligase CoaBC [Acidimicrobiia bacterium]|nr:bifunctional phosphopantothenoylcysteine decarboxylase/phosphopantothenate--cysteine ligase CoaBC [Acidimicrobiia bacterium]